MADEINQPTTEEQARSMGWKPKEEFSGDQAKWVDAAEFLRRGEEVLPIVQASNRKLRETVESQNARLVELERVNRANAMALEALQEANREQTVQTTERTLEQIEAGIAAAREADNVQDELALLREHHAATDKLTKAKQKPTPNTQLSTQPSQDMTQTSAFQQFLKDNTWFQTDSVMRAAAIQIQNDMVASGEIPVGMPQADRLNKVADEVRKRFHVQDNHRRTGANRVEGGSGTNASTSSSGKSYSDLPDDAKAACDKAAKRLVFGAGKRYKDEAAWRDSYVKSYFS